MVLMSVDLPRPVWPEETDAISAVDSMAANEVKLTNADDIELEAPLDRLASQSAW